MDHDEIDDDHVLAVMMSFTAIAHAVATQDIDGANTRLTEFLGVDTGDELTPSRQLWTLAVAGPAIVASAMDKLAMARICGHQGCEPGEHLWGIDTAELQTAGLAEATESDMDALTAARSVVAQLNGDDGYAQDVITAHFDAVAAQRGLVPAHESLLNVVLHHVHMMAACITEGVLSQ